MTLPANNLCVVDDDEAVRRSLGLLLLSQWKPFLSLLARLFRRTRAPTTAGGSSS